jgi:hypothetical protein
MNWTSVTFAAAVCLSVEFSTTRLSGQVTLLTSREAKELIELVPDVAAARMRGECPTLSLFGSGYDTSVFSIEARGSCWEPGDPSSMLINKYTVDRRTGIANVYASKSVVSTPAMREKAKAMLDSAKSRLLSIAESRCIAFEAAKTEFSSRGENVSLSLEEIPANNNPWQSFHAEGRVGAERATISRQYSVSRETGSVWNEQTGSEVVSAGLGALRSRILALRNTPTLSLEDALAVALRVPSILAKMSDGCSRAETAENSASADEVFIAIHNRCPGGADAVEVAAAVNMITGAVSSPRTHARLKSPEADQAAREIFSRINNSRLNERLTIEAQCRVGR